MLPRFALVVIALTLVASCGGGGSYSSPSSPTVPLLFTPRFSASSLQGTWTGTIREGFLFGNAKTAHHASVWRAAGEHHIHGNVAGDETEPPRMRSGTFTTTPPFTNLIFGGQVWQIVLTLRSSVPPEPCENETWPRVESELSLSPALDALGGTMLEFECDFFIADVTVRKQ